MKRILTSLIVVGITSIVYAQDIIKQSIQFISQEPGRIAMGSNYYYQLRATNSVGGVINYSVNELPAWLNIIQPILRLRSGQYYRW